MTEQWAAVMFTDETMVDNFMSAAAMFEDHQESATISDTSRWKIPVGDDMGQHFNSCKRWSAVLVC